MNKYPCITYDVILNINDIILNCMCVTGERGEVGTVEEGRGHMLPEVR